MSENALGTYFDKLLGILKKDPLVTKVEEKKRILSRDLGYLKARVLLLDGSVLQLAELVDARLHKTRYAYHYQDADGRAVFRYDNAPHHPELATFPHHKHVGKTAQASDPPTLAKILEEISHALGHPRGRNRDT